MTTIQETEFFGDLIERNVTGILTSGSRFWGRMLCYSDNNLLLEATDGHRILIRRKSISQIERVV
jgi:hypothetical protein